MKAFKVGLDVGLWPSAANLDSSLTRALKRPFLCSVSKGHVWFNFGLHGQKGWKSAQKTQRTFPQIQFILLVYSLVWRVLDLDPQQSKIIQLGTLNKSN